MVLSPKAWWTYLRSSGDNFHVVVPGRIFRGATPSPENLEKWYLKYGVRTWIDLRQVDDWDGNERTTTAEHAHFDDQVATCRRLGIERVWLPISDRKPTSDESVCSIMYTLEQATKDRPLLVACQGGRHRTGLAIALYRMRVQGWPAKDAMAEAVHCGYYRHSHEQFDDHFMKLVAEAKQART